MAHPTPAPVPWKAVALPNEHGGWGLRELGYGVLTLLLVAAGYLASPVASALPLP